MKLLNSIILAFSMALGMACMLPAQAGSGSAVVLLDADFDDKVADAPIGTGGAALGEPIFVSGSMDAIVRKEAGSTSNQELELSAGPGSTVLSAGFELLDAVEITQGVVRIRGDIILGKADTFSEVRIAVREQGSSAQSFANVRLVDSGTLALSGAGIGLQSWPDRVLLEGRNHFELEFDMDAGRYWLWFNGEPLAPLEGYAHGITDRGVGRVIASLGAPSSDPRAARLDNLEVLWLIDDALFIDRFESTTAQGTAGLLDPQ